MSDNEKKKPDKFVITRVIEFITPELAKEYLELNTNINRPFSQSLVDKYASDIDNGRWHETAPTTPIAFDWDFNLINGQHRLRAIIKAKKGIHCPVESGHDPESFKAIDQGKARDSSDLFVVMFKKQYGFAPKNHRYVTSIAYGMIMGLKTAGDSRPSKLEAAANALKHYDLIQRYFTLMKKNTCHVFSTYLCAAFVNASLYFGDSHIEPLATRLGLGEWTGATDQMKVLSDGLIKAMAPAAAKGTYTKHVTSDGFYAYTVSAIRAALLCKKLTRCEQTSQDWGVHVGDYRLKKTLASQVTKTQSQVLHAKEQHQPKVNG